MELYLIRDKRTGICFIQNGEPFFYAFSDYTKAEQFCNSHPGTEIDTQEIQTDEDDEYLIYCLYQKGFKGGYLNGNFKAINQSNPELVQVIPEQAAMLQLLLWQATGREQCLTNQRFYFFATITDDGYLAFANSEGYIFTFTDTSSMDIRLAKLLYGKGYEVIRYVLDTGHQYLVNPRTATECRINTGLKKCQE